MEEAYVIGQYTQFVIGDLGRLFRGAGVTLTITIVSILLGTILGIILGIIRCSKNKVVRFLPLIIMEPLRNSPLVVQLFLVYYGLPVVAGILFSQYTAAIMTISLNTAAFFGVLVHNSISAIPQGQWEAGYALGHGKVSTFLHVISHQAFRLLIPQAITLYIGQLQCSSIVSLISMQDLSRVGQLLSVRTLQPFLIWGLVFAIYYIVSFPLARLANYLEKRVNYSY